MRDTSFTSLVLLFLLLSVFVFATCGDDDDDTLDDDDDNQNDDDDDNQDDDDDDNDDSWPPDAPTPPMGEALLGLTLADGWTDPRSLPSPVNTTGWEDSAFISADGRRLYFGYCRYDYYALTQRGEEVVTGPDRPGQKGPAFDIWEAWFTGNAWTAESSSVNSDIPDLHEAAIGVSRDQTRIAFIRFADQADIYLADKTAAGWSTPELLPSPLNTPCEEDNPHLSPDGLTIYFDSNRSDTLGSSCRDESDGLMRRTIYRSTYSDGSWSLPEELPGAPNETLVHWQVFVTEDEQEVYWSGIGADCPDSCIYRATLQSDGSYKNRSIVAKPSAFDAPFGNVISIGEISITADGRFLYFVYMVRTSE